MARSLGRGVRRLPIAGRRVEREPDWPRAGRERRFLAGDPCVEGWFTYRTLPCLTVTGGDGGFGEWVFDFLPRCEATSRVRGRGMESWNLLAEAFMYLRRCGVL